MEYFTNPSIFIMWFDVDGQEAANWFGELPWTSYLCHREHIPATPTVLLRKNEAVGVRHGDTESSEEHEYGQAFIVAKEAYFVAGHAAERQSKLTLWQRKRFWAKNAL